MITILIILITIFIAIFTSINTKVLPCLFNFHVNIDQDFSKKEKKSILKAMAMWQRSTCGLVRFCLNDTNAKYILYNKGYYALNFVKTTSNNKQIKKFEKKYKLPLLGLMSVQNDTNLIFMVSDKIKNKNICTRVAAHEIGHALGLTHDEDENSLMYYRIWKAEKVTSRDVQQLINRIKNNY